MCNRMKEIALKIVTLMIFDFGIAFGVLVIAPKLFGWS